MDSAQTHNSSFPSATLPLMNWGCEVFVEAVSDAGWRRYLGDAPLMEGPGAPHGDAKYEVAFDARAEVYCRERALTDEVGLEITLAAHPQCGGGGAAHALLRVSCDRQTTSTLRRRALEARGAEAAAQFEICQAFSVVCRPGRRRAVEAKITAEARGEAVVLTSIQFNVPAGDAAYMSDWLAMLHGEHR